MLKGVRAAGLQHWIPLESFSVTTCDGPYISIELGRHSTTSRGTVGDVNIVFVGIHFEQ